MFPFHPRYNLIGRHAFGDQYKATDFFVPVRIFEKPLYLKLKKLPSNILPTFFINVRNKRYVQ